MLAGRTEGRALPHRPFVGLSSAGSGVVTPVPSTKPSKVYVTYDDAEMRTPERKKSERQNNLVKRSNISGSHQKNTNYFFMMSITFMSDQIVLRLSSRCASYSASVTKVLLVVPVDAGVAIHVKRACAVGDGAPPWRVVLHSPPFSLSHPGGLAEQA